MIWPKVTKWGMEVFTGRFRGRYRHKLLHQRTSSKSARLISRVSKAAPWF